MINLAASSPNGVNIPNQRTVRNEIIDMFMKYMASLRGRLNVSAFLVEYTILTYVQSRAMLSREKLILPVTGGRLQIQMHTLLLLDTGSKRLCLGNGNPSQYF